jgi:predicted  nucleic acid-binding Zn-ribbon protein
MSDNLDQRLQTAVQSRNKLESEIQRIIGRREAATKNLDDLETEIRDKGLDPDTLTDTVAELRTRYETAVGELEEGIQAAQIALAPYLETP